MSLRDFYKRLTGKVTDTSVSARGSSVAINGPNTGQVTINDLESIIEAVNKSNTTQYAVLAKGVEGDLHTEFDRQIDHYREQMNSGAVNLALKSFEKLLTDQIEKLSSLLKFRIKANIAICHYQLGNIAKASNLLLEACTYAPEDKRAIANKALAYILQDDCDKALEYGKEKIIEYPDNELLAGYILQATRIKYHNHCVFKDPFREFSERVQLSQNVRIAHIHLLASRKVEGWRDTAKKFLDEYPDDMQVKNLIANDILHHYVENRQSANGFTFTKDEVEELKLAAQYIDAEWQQFKSSDRVANASDLQNIQNLLILYKLTGDVNALIKNCTFVLEELTSDQEVIETTARSLIDLQESELFEQAVLKVTNPMNARKLRFLNNLVKKDWKSLSDTQDYNLEKFDDQFATHAKVVVYIARADEGKARGKEQLANLLSTCELDSRGRLLLFDFAATSKINIIAQMAHAYGHDRVTEHSETIEFFHYMKLLRFLTLWREIVQRLESHPALSDNYELKHMLALGFLNEHPIRAEAVAFFESYVIPNPQGFELLAGVFYFKRNDFLQAVPLVEKYLSDGGTDLFAFVVLCDIAKLSSDSPSLAKLFNMYDPSCLEGTPEQRIHVAKLRASIGKGADALADAYEILIENPDSAPVALGFFSIFLTVEKDKILDSTVVISNGCYYRLLPSEGTPIEKIVNPNTSDLLGLSPEKVDFYTRRVWGKGVGYEFIQEKPQGNIVWRVDEIKHPYLHAFHQICQNYETQFPDAGGVVGDTRWRG
ncbi:tetratricopeptide repeat protein [Pseudomonas koreensis]